MANISELLTLPNMAVYYERKVLTLPPYISESYFPATKIATDILSYLNKSQGSPVLAKASKYDAQPVPGNREPFGKEVFRTNFFRSKSVLNEQDLEELNAANIHGDDALLTSLLANMFDDKTQLLVNMRARREWLAMQALMLGKINLLSNGVKADVAYPSDQDFESTVKTSWTNTDDSDPITDMQAAIDIMKSKGQIPNQVLMNTATFRQIQNSERIKTSFYPSGVDVTKVRLKQDDVVDAIMSELHVVPVVYDQGFVDQEATGTKNFTPYVPTGKIVLMNAPLPQGNYVMTGSTSTGATPSANIIGHMAFAPTPEELGARNGKIMPENIQIFDTGVAFHEYSNPQLVQTEDIVSMNVLPSFEGSRGVFRMDVNPAAASTGDTPASKQ